MITRRVALLLRRLRRIRTHPTQRLLLRPLTDQQYRGLTEMIALALKVRTDAKQDIARKWHMAVAAVLDPTPASPNLSTGRRILTLERAHGGELLVRADETERLLLQKLERVGGVSRPIRGSQLAIEAAEVRQLGEALIRYADHRDRVRSEHAS